MATAQSHDTLQSQQEASESSKTTPAVSSSNEIGAATASIDPAAASEPSKKSSEAWERVISKERREKGSSFLKAYGKTWIAMSPIYLMTEAAQGKKPGSKFKQEFAGLASAAEELRQVATTSSTCTPIHTTPRTRLKPCSMIVLDERIRLASEETSKTAAMIQEAGQHAVVVVSTSLEKSKEQIHKSSPKIKQAVLKNGKDCVIVVDKALKHPLVITGISKLARANGIPHAEAVLQVASLGLSKILKHLPDDEDIAAMLEEIDATQLEQSASQEVKDEAQRIAKAAERPPASLEATASTTTPAKKKDSTCIVC